MHFKPPLILIALVVVFYSCTTQKNDLKCQSKILNLMFICDAQIVDFNLNESSQGKLRNRIMKTINDLTNDISERSGGFRQQGDGLFNGCESSVKYKRFFNEKMNDISELYEQLNLDQNMSIHFRELLEHYCISEERYFNDTYFASNNVTTLLTDLSILQLDLMNPYKIE